MDLDNIFFNADSMEYITSLSDVKRINALKDFLKLDTLERVQQGGSIDIAKYLILKMQIEDIFINFDMKDTILKLVSKIYQQI